MRKILSLLPLILVASLAKAPVVAADVNVDLTNRTAINRFLASLGVDPSEAVIQLGLRNYAGPNCPGRQWTCTKATEAVVQVASRGDGGGRNVFVCRPAAPGTDEETNTCVIVQVNEDGKNRAICREHNKQEQGLVEQECIITQTNDTGANIAIVDQSVVMEHEDTTQRSEQRSRITQINGPGSNLAQVSQRANLSTEAEEEEEADVFQEQDVIQDSVVDQETDTGNNRANVFQSHRLEAEAEETATAEQRQNADSPFGETSCIGDFFPFDYNPNVCALFDQASTNGALLINSRQFLRHHTEAEEVEGEVFQQQGSSRQTGGLAAIFHQDSAGLARRVTSQDERQTADADDTGPVSQIQFTGQGPKKNSNQMSNPDNFLIGTQNVVQLASDPTFQQATLDAVAFPISGEGRFRQFVRQNDASEQQTVTGGPPGLFARIDCQQGEPPDEGETFHEPEEPCFASGGPFFPDEGGGID